MEKKFYTDDFEQFLKETADNFRMYPSKRVWNSLYNNLHPGRKWPSLSICLLLVSSIIFIGLAHKTEITGSGNSVNQGKNVPTHIVYQESGKMATQSAIKNVEPAAIVKAPTSLKNEQALLTAHGNYRNRQLISFNEPAATFTAEKNHSYTSTTSHPESDVLALNEPININDGRSLMIEQAAPLTENNLATRAGAIMQKRFLAVYSNNDLAAGEIKPVLRQALLPIVRNIKPALDQEWIEDYAFHNQPTSSLKSKLSYELYVTPSVGNRSLVKNLSYDLPARNSLVGASSQNQPLKLNHSKALNLEAGYNLIYNYTKSLHLKAGVQFNYTSYRIRAHELGHSTLTTLLLNDPSGGIELSQRSTNLANLSGIGSDKNLNSSTFQVSLPFGADVKIAGRHNFQWYFGATVQPTYVLFGNAYLVSSDMKNYVYDAKFLRKWNLNTGVESFVSYRTKKGVTFNAGPQFRYQLFSTYDKKYSYDEKLYNLGMKIGMIKNF